MKRWDQPPSLSPMESPLGKIQTSRNITTEKILFLFNPVEKTLRKYLLTKHHLEELNTGQCQVLTLKGQETNSNLTNEDTRKSGISSKTETVTKSCGCIREAAVSGGWAGRQLRIPDEIA